VVRIQILRSPVQSTRHTVARNLDRLQNDPQRAPLREDEGPQEDALHSTADGATRNVPGRLSEGACGVRSSVGVMRGRPVVVRDVSGNMTVRSCHVLSRNVTERQKS